MKAIKFFLNGIEDVVTYLMDDFDYCPSTFECGLILYSFSLCDVLLNDQRGAIFTMSLFLAYYNCRIVSLNGKKVDMIFDNEMERMYIEKEKLKNGTN